MTEETKEIKKDTKWKKGVSANPAGKPKGAKNRTTLIKQAIEGDMIDAVKEDVIAVFQKGVAMALAGDQAMIKLIVDKFVPNAKAGENEKSKGIGGINIIVQGMESPAIDITPIEEEQDEDGISE